MPATCDARADDALEFLEALCDLPTDAWARVAGRVRSPAHSAAAQHALKVLVRQEGLALSAWYVNDFVDTLSWQVSGHFARGEARRARDLFRATIAATRTAAFALLLRRGLGEPHFWLLYEPFQQVHPQRLWLVEGSLVRVFTESSCAPATGRINVRTSAPTVR